MTDSPDRLDQLAHQSHDLADEVTRQSAVLAALSARVETLDSRLEAAQAAQARSAELVERLSVEMDFAPALESIAAQVAALRQAQANSAERLEQLASAQSEMSRIEASVRHLRDELLAKLGAAESSLRDEARTAAGRSEAPLTAIAKDLQDIRDDVLALQELQDHLAAIDRRQTDLRQSGDRLVGRFEQVVEEVAEIKESVLRSERHVETSLDHASERHDELEREVGGWRARIEAQDESVRAARGVADAMRAEAARIAEAHHSTAEAERLFEARVESAIADLKADMEHALEHLRQAREKRWSSLQDDNAERDRHLSQLDSAMLAAQAQMEQLEKGLNADVHEQSLALQSLRRDLVNTLEALRTAVTEGVHLVELALPDEEHSAEAAERRESLRRALRAGRERHDR